MLNMIFNNAGSTGIVNMNDSLWYPKDSPFELVAYTDSDNARATQDRRSTTGGCQFLGNKLIYWQCKKQIVVATFTTEAEYVEAASCYRQVGDKVVYKEWDDIMERAATTASSLEPKQGQINQGVESTVPVESHHTPNNAPSTFQPPISTPSIQTTHAADEPATMPNDSPLPRVQSLGSTTLAYGATYTKLILRVKKLEHKVKTSQHIRKARAIISNDKEDLEDPSKQGRKISKIDENPSSLVQDEGTSWIQEDYEIKGRTSANTEILLDQKEPAKLVEDLGSCEKGEKEISTVIPEVSTAAKNLMYIRRSAEKRKDKGKAIMKENKSVKKKSKKQLEQERLSEVNYAILSKKFPIMNQLDWKLLRWKLHENYGVHTLFMDGTPMEINMLVEKKYPLIKELLKKMLNLKLEAEEEGTMEFELINFIKSLLEE
nr:putative ribonuclease H-like domain-containing protein [Tanacetum cinerariifolium]